jgi:hypothetical protein
MPQNWFHPIWNATYPFMAQAMKPPPVKPLTATTTARAGGVKVTRTVETTVQPQQPQEAQQPQAEAAPHYPPKRNHKVTAQT